MIALYISIIVLSFILGILASYYQFCYRNETQFEIKQVLPYAKKNLVSCLLFVFLNEAVTLFLLFRHHVMELNDVVLPQYVLIWEGMLLAAWIDLKTKKIPNPIFLILLGVRCVGIITEMVLYPHTIFEVLLDAFAGMIAGGLVVLICRLLSRGGVGAGDVKLFAIMGFYFGLIPIMNVLFYTTFIAAISAAFLLITKKAEMKSTLAFGPFAFIGVNIYYVLLSLA